MTEKSMKRYAFQKTVLSLALLLFLSMASFSFNTCYDLKESESSERVDLRTRGGNRESMLHIDQIPLLESEFEDGSVSILSESLSILKYGVQTHQVKVGMTNTSFMEFSDIELTGGTFLTEDSVKYGRNVAVISESLANKLFMSLNAVGNEIELFNSTYTIVGIYKEPASLLTLLRSDGYEHLYIPFTSLRNMTEQPIETVFIKSPSLKNETFKENTFQTMLLKKFDLLSEGYKIIIYDKTPTILSQIQELFLFCLAIGIIIAIIRLLLYFWKKNAAMIKSSLSTMYLKEFIRKHFFFCLRFCLVSLIGLGGIFFVYSFAKPHLYIPSQYLPQENIFDLTFYAGEIKTAIQNSNALAGYRPTPLERSFSELLIINLVLAGASILAMISLSSGIKLTHYLRADIKTYIKIGLFGTLLAFASHMLLTVWGCYPWGVSIKSLAVILAFFLLNCLSHEKARSLR